MFLFVLGFSILGIVLVWLKTGDVQAAVRVTEFMLPFLLIAGYFSTRGDKPSRLEKALARAWVIVRRFICFTAAFVFGLGAVIGFVAWFRSPRAELLAVATVAAALAAFAVWTGAYGAGYSRSFSDDKPTHEERKRRYGWK